MLGLRDRDVGNTDGGASRLLVVLATHLYVA